MLYWPAMLYLAIVNTPRSAYMETIFEHECEDA